MLFGTLKTIRTTIIHTGISLKHNKLTRAEIQGYHINAQIKYLNLASPLLSLPLSECAVLVSPSWSHLDTGSAGTAPPVRPAALL